MNLFVLSIAIFGVLLNAMAQLAIKSGLSKLGALSLGKGVLNFLFIIFTSPGIIAGLFCYVISVGVWMYVLSKMDVSIAYPLLSIGYVVNLFIAAWLFGEPLTLNKILGVGLIILGVVVLYRGAQA